MKTTNISIIPTPNAKQPPATTTNTADRSWPGDHEWNDDDYKLFVELYTQGKFPEIHDNPIAWDKHFVLARDRADTDRPTLISVSDFNKHLTPRYHIGFGLLVTKLWEVARSKGFTKAYEHQQEQALKEQELLNTEAEKERLRREIEQLKKDLPTPEPAQPIDPRQQWHEQLNRLNPPAADLTEKVKSIQQAVVAGQPFRNAALAATTAADSSNDSFGPLMLPESADALADPFEPLDATPPLRKWAPDATTSQIINGAARDLADLVSLLASRQRVAVGYAADRESINQAVQLTRSLRDLTQVIHTTELTTQAKKRGRPKKERIINPDLTQKYGK